MQNIDWDQITGKLPVEKHQRQERLNLWKGFDFNNNGYLSLAECDKGIRDILKSDQLFDAKPAIMRAFQYAKDYKPSKKPSQYGSDYIEKREFRVFLIALRQRFEYLQAFKRIDTGGDGRIDFGEFSSAQGLIQKWVGPFDPATEFQSMDNNGGGQVLFDEFCLWSFQKSLDLEDDDDFEDVDGVQNKDPRLISQIPTSKPNPARQQVNNQPNIDWNKITGKLPVEKHQKNDRLRMWRGFDVNGNGYLSLAECDKGIRDVLKSDQIFDAKPAIMRAFQYAKDAVPSKKPSKYGSDYIEKREFRVFLIALRQRFEYLQAFQRIDTGGDGRIDFGEFSSAQGLIQRWVGPFDPVTEFQYMDSNGGGQVLFDEFCLWSFQKSLDLEDDDDFEDADRIQKKDPRLISQIPISKPNPVRQPMNNHSSNNHQDIDWAKIAKKLPTSTNEKRERIRLWNLMDMNANGYLSLAEVDRGIKTTIKSENLFDAKPAILRAFQFAKDYNKSPKPNEHGEDYIEKKEFRVFLMALRQRFEYFQAFKRIDTGGDGRIDFEEFSQAKDMIQKWIGPFDPQTEFLRMDQNRGGQILFDEFCVWSFQKSLDLEDDDDFQDTSQGNGRQSRLISDNTTNPPSLINYPTPKKGQSPMRKSFEGVLNNNRNLMQAYQRLETQESKAQHLDFEAQKSKQYGEKKDAKRTKDIQRMKDDYEKIPKMNQKEFDAGIKSEMGNSVIRMSEYRVQAEELQQEIQEKLDEKTQALEKAQEELRQERERSQMLRQRLEELGMGVGPSSTFQVPLGSNYSTRNPNAQNRIMSDSINQRSGTIGQLPDFGIKASGNYQLQQQQQEQDEDDAFWDQ